MNVPMALRNKCNDRQYQYENQMANRGPMPTCPNMNPMYSPYQMPMYRPYMVNPNIESYCKMMDLLTRLMGHKVSVLVVGREEPYKDLTIKKVENGVLFAQSEKDVCAIPVKTINTLFIPKNIADKVERKYE